MAKIKMTNQRHIEAEGFYHGTQAVKPQEMESEITAFHQECREQVIHDATPGIKQSEAKTAIYLQRKTDAEQQWFRLAQDGQVVPEVMRPLVAINAAMGAIGGEAILLAPVFDAMGIASREMQYFAAIVIVIVAAGLVSIALHAAQNKQQTLSKLRLMSLLAGCAGVSVFLIYLGWWRAQSMIFSASLAVGKPLSRFMADNTGITRTFIILLTLALPIFAEISFSWGVRKLREFWHWSKVRRAVRKYPKKYEEERRRRETLEEARDRKITVLNEREKQWIEVYRQNWNVGKRIGAIQQSFSHVLWKTCGMFLGSAACCAIANPIVSHYIPLLSSRLLAYAAVTACVSVVAYIHFYKAWDRPTPKQLLQQRAVIWCESAATPMEPVAKPQHYKDGEIRDSSADARQTEFAGTTSARSSTRWNGGNDV